MGFGRWSEQSCPRSGQSSECARNHWTDRCAVEIRAAQGIRSEGLGAKPVDQQRLSVPPLQPATIVLHGAMRLPLAGHRVFQKALSQQRDKIIRVAQAYHGRNGGIIARMKRDCSTANSITLLRFEGHFAERGRGCCESKFKYHDFVSMRLAMTRFGGRR